MLTLEELRPIVGDAHVREATEEEAIDGVRPRFVAEPASIEEISGVLALAQRHRSGVAPRGGGTKLDLGNPPESLDLILDMGRLDRVLEHAAGDLVVSMEAGARVEAVQAELAGAGQMLALDGYEPSATAGGIIAANTSGPRRLRYGTVRDLLIGITIVLPDGTIAKAGGKVVKNVAGYDLGKLMTGSLGTLGVIAKAIFRLHPRPAARRLVEGEFQSSQAVDAAVQRLLHSILVPTAIQISWPPEGLARLGVLLEGVEPSVVSQAATAASLLGLDASPRTAGEDEVAPRWEALIRGSAERTALELKITCLPAELGETIRLVRDAARLREMDGHLTGGVGNGILYLRSRAADPDVASALIHELRAGLRRGHVTVLKAPPEVKRKLDVWDAVGDAERLMRSVKDRFDPGHILNPGRFVGGI